MTRLVSDHLQMEVELDAGIPSTVRMPGARMPLPVTRIFSRWRVETDWWREPLGREYWKLALRQGGGRPELLCELYLDRAGGWRLSRVFD
ncbi:MAG: hypothetical protein ACYDGR_09230 [Candidatus Dormibacteria bacterium]